MTSLWDMALSAERESLMPPALRDTLLPHLMSGKAQQARNPHLAIEALRKLVAEESGKVSRHNLVRQRAFGERVTDLMIRYTNQQLTSAEVIAGLIAMAQEISAEAQRGLKFSPPLDEDQLASYDAVAQNPSAIDVLGEGKLADIARDLVTVMQRDIRTDWTAAKTSGPGCGRRSAGSWRSISTRRTKHRRQSVW